MSTAIFSLVLITSIGYCIFFKAEAAAFSQLLSIYEKKASVISNYIQKDINQLHNISVKVLKSRMWWKLFDTLCTFNISKRPWISKWMWRICFYLVININHEKENLFGLKLLECYTIRVTIRQRYFITQLRSLSIFNYFRYNEIVMILLFWNIVLSILLKWNT